MKKIIKVSIVVPIFNAEKYLNTSIKSIQSQTLQDIEIILVNDGSDDNSLRICHEYAKMDKRIQIIDKPNGGVSSARNVGIEIAQGEYIGFVDPDDWVEPEMYEEMYNQAKKTDSDLCMCNYKKHNGNHVINVKINLEKDLLNKKEILNDILPDMISCRDLNSGQSPVMGSVWRLLIKKELINKYNLRFVEGIPLMEDLIFCIQTLLKCSKICINKSFFYHYIINENSAVTSYKKNLDKIQKKVFRIIEHYLKEEGVLELYENRLNIRYVIMCLSLIANEVHKDNTKKEKEKIKAIYEFCRDDKLKKILGQIDTSAYTFRKKMVLLALESEWGLFLYLYYNILIRIFNKLIWIEKFYKNKGK